jgi:MFS family permease
VLPLSIASALAMAATGGMRLLVQLFLDSIGATSLVIGLVGSLDALGMLAGSFAWGAMSDRLRRRPLLLAAMGGLALTCAVFVFLPPSSVALPASLLQAFARTGFAAMGMAMISAVSIAGRRGRNLSYLTSASALGFALGGGIMGFVLDAVGFRWSFLVATMLPALGLVSLLFLPHEPPMLPSERQTAWRMALRAGLAPLYVGTMLRQMAIHGTFALIFVYMAAEGIPAGLMGVVAAANMATQTLAMMLFGRLADRIGRRRVFVLGFALSAVVPCVFALADAAWSMALGFVLLGLSFSSLYMGSTAHIGDRIPEARQGTMLGLFESVRGMGGIVGPILAGAIRPAIGFEGMFLVMAAIAALGLIVILVRKGRP